MYSVKNLEPRLFSFNNPLGACPDCNGLGKKLSVSADLVIDSEKSIEDNAIIPYKNYSKIAIYYAHQDLLNNGGKSK